MKKLLFICALSLALQGCGSTAQVTPSMTYEQRMEIYAQNTDKNAASAAKWSSFTGIFIIVGIAIGIIGSSSN